MSNRQLHNLTPISNSIDAADLFVVIDKSKLTTNKITLGELSDSIDGTIFLSSSYAETSSFTTGTAISTSFAEYVITSSNTSRMSGSGVFAWSSSFSDACEHCWTDFDLFEITSSDDTLNVYEISQASGLIIINPRSPFVNSYVLKPLSHADEVGQRIISSTSGRIIYTGLPARIYEFEVANLYDTNSQKKSKFSVLIKATGSADVRYGEFKYFAAGGAQYASGSNVFAISSSYSDRSSFSDKIRNVESSSITYFAQNASGSLVIANSASVAKTASFAQHCGTSYTSSNGPLPGMILLYAGVRVSGSNAWYNCDGGVYSTSYTELSTSLQSKFTDGVSSNRLPKISSNLNSGSGPYNMQVYISQSQLGHPTNDQISQSYGTTTITGSYPEGLVYGPDIGPSGSAFYYNIKR